MKRLLYFMLGLFLLGVCCCTAIACRSVKTTTEMQETVNDRQTVVDTKTTDRTDNIELNKKVDSLSEMLKQFRFDYEKTTLSPPDSVGKQYPVVVEHATGEATSQETTRVNEQLGIQLSTIQLTVEELKAQMDRQAESKGETTVVKSSPWNPPNIAILAVAVGIIILQVLKWKRS